MSDTSIQASTPFTPKNRRAPLIAHDARGLNAGLIAMMPELRARALRLSADRATADDLVQDTVERALKFADQYQRGAMAELLVFVWMPLMLFLRK